MLISAVTAEPGELPAPWGSGDGPAPAPRQHPAAHEPYPHGQAPPPGECRGTWGDMRGSLSSWGFPCTHRMTCTPGSVQSHGDTCSHGDRVHVQLKDQMGDRAIPHPWDLELCSRAGAQGVLLGGHGVQEVRCCHCGCDRLWASTGDILAGTWDTWKLGEGSIPPALPRAPVRERAGQKSFSSPLLPDFPLPCPGLLGDLLPTPLTSPWDPSSTICCLEKPCSLSCSNP